MKTLIFCLALILLPHTAMGGEVIRLLLKDGQQSVDVRIQGEVTAYDSRGELLAGVEDGARLAFTAGAGGMVINGKRIFEHPVWISTLKGRVAVGETRVNGDLVVRLMPDNTLSVIAYLDVEEYVRGVVPAEAPPKWEIEVLKAQAVAARTYALYRKKLKVGSDYDVSADVLSQVYGGTSIASPTSDRAVEETAGLVLTHRGVLINAMFHSCCGGETEDVAEVFGNDLEYLKSVEGRCPPEGPKMQWDRWMSSGEIKEALEKAGHRVGRITNIEIMEKTESQRASRVRIVHGAGSLVLKGNDFRKAVGWEVIPSTLFSLKKVRDRYHFAGKGAGHGVGLCQWGAREMALEGKSFDEILRYYYKDIRIEPYRPGM